MKSNEVIVRTYVRALMRASDLRERIAHWPKGAIDPSGHLRDLLALHELQSMCDTLSWVLDGKVDLGEFPPAVEMRAVTAPAVYDRTYRQAMQELECARDDNQDLPPTP